MISAGDFRNGVTFEEDGNVVQVVEFQHVKPGKGAAFVRTKIKNVITGSVIEKSYNPTAKFPTAFIERKDMEYSYNDDGLYYFMDQETYELEPINASDLGDNFKFVKEEMMCKISSYKGMKIKQFAYTVKEEEVQAEIDRLLDRNARKVEVTDRPAQNGDIANIDFVGTVDGVKFDGGEAEGFDLTLGSGQFIPGFEDQVVGMNIGETKDVNVTFPLREKLTGKDIPAAVKPGLPQFKGQAFQPPHIVPPAVTEYFHRFIGTQGQMQIADGVESQTGTSLPWIRI